MAGVPEKINVLLVGGGGREHALAWKLRQSPRLADLWLTDPGNPGLAALGRAVDVPVDYASPYRLQQFCRHKKIGLVVIGPEDPLALGLADALAGEGRFVFGPGRAAAQLEADKAWCKQILRNASVPMAEGRSFTDYTAARTFLETRDEPQVIKAAGLAKGKGVIVPDSHEAGLEALEAMMVGGRFGQAGRAVVIEERLEGREVSVLALVDGRNIFVMEPCQDHKRLRDGDAGPNTGGMGAFCPGGLYGTEKDEESLRIVERDIIVPTVDALRREGIEYRGVLYAGVMLTPAGPKVLEFNVRFGDPECQALMVRLDADLIEVMLATCGATPGGLADVDISWRPAASCCIVLASEGYPDSPHKGDAIEGLEEAERVAGVTVFHAGTKRAGASGPVVTAGGRVLGVTAAAESLPEARDRAYEACELIRFDGKQMRTDIAREALAARA